MTTPMLHQTPAATVKPPRLPNVPLRHNLVIAAGAILGVLARFLVGEWSKDHLALGFPVGTLIVNLSGCLLIGVVQTVFLELRVLRREMQIFLVVGVLGGFTTFSTFSVETLRLLQTGSIAQAIAYQTFSLAGGIAAVALGMGATHVVNRWLPGRGKS